MKWQLRILHLKVRNRVSAAPTQSRSHELTTSDRCNVGDLPSRHICGSDSCPCLSCGRHNRNATRSPRSHTVAKSQPRKVGPRHRGQVHRAGATARSLGAEGLIKPALTRFESTHLSPGHLSIASVHAYAIVPVVLETRRACRIPRLSRPWPDLIPPLPPVELGPGRAGPRFVGSHWLQSSVQYQSSVLGA